MPSSINLPSNPSIGTGMRRSIASLFSPAFSPGNDFGAAALETSRWARNRIQSWAGLSTGVKTIPKGVSSTLWIGLPCTLSR